MKKKLTSQELDSYIKRNWPTKTSVDMERETGVSDSTIRDRARRLKLPPKSSFQKTYSIPEQLKQDKKSAVKRNETTEIRKKNKLLIDEVIELRKMLDIKDNLESYKAIKIIPKKSNNGSESTAFVLASDWHVEQRVDPHKILYPNEYNLEIAGQRSQQFFQNTLDLIQTESKKTKINTLVLWLGGDFITGNIHTENLKLCLLSPMQAICYARDLIISGIEFLLQNSDLDIVIPYNYGNHSRITEKVWVSTEEDNSLEYILYDAIAKHFKGINRVKMVAPRGSVSVVEVYGLKIGFVHGHHGFKYKDGVGGLYIPARKYILRKFRSAGFYLVCMGHHHQYLQDTLFICNGSMIGYDQYADSCGFDYDVPKQTFFLISQKHKCRTITTPILFDV